MLLISFPIPAAMREKSLFPPLLPCDWSNLCFASEREGREDLVRIDSTHARNSLVLSWTGIAKRCINRERKNYSKCGIEGMKERLWIEGCCLVRRQSWLLLRSALIQIYTLRPATQDITLWTLPSCDKYHGKTFSPRPNDRKTGTHTALESGLSRLYVHADCTN